MSKILLTFIIFISFTLNSEAQTSDFDCENLLSKEIDLNEIEENIETFKIDFQAVMLCEFDSVDYQIMIGPKKDMIDFAVDMLKYLKEAEKEKIYTFSDLVKGLKEFIKAEEYAIIRQIAVTRNALVRKNAILKNWEEDMISLKIIGFNNEQVEIIKGVVEKNEGKTFKEILEISYPTLMLVENNKGEHSIIEKKTEDISSDNSPIMTCDGVIKLWEGAYTFISYSECISCSQKINRPILFYFTGYGCIECMEFMANILLDSEIKEIIKNNYVYITMVTDAVEMLNENEMYFSELQNIEIGTEGARSLDLQLENFKNSDRPYFVIVSQKGKILREYSNGENLKKFKSFLK